MLVAAENDFGHDVAVVTVVFDGLLGAEVVEAVDAGFGVVAEREFAVAVDYRETLCAELEGYITTGFDYIDHVGLGNETHEGYELCFAAAHRAC